MMKFAKKQTPWKKLAFVAIIVILLSLAGYGLYAQQQSLWPFGRGLEVLADDNYGKVDYSPPSEKEIKQGQAQKAKTVEDDQSKAMYQSLDITITAANQNNDIVQIRTLISQVITGTCTLTLTSGDRTKTYQTNTQSLASTSTCAGYDIPVSDLIPGDWSIKLVVSSMDNSLKGEVASTILVR